MYPRFLQLIIRKQVGELSTHTTKYTSPALTQKVFTNIKRVGKGFFGVETPLFEGMLVEHQGDEKRDADEHVEEVNTGDAEGYDSVAHGEVLIVAKEQSISSPTPTIPPPQPPQDIPSTSQVQQTPPPSPQRVKKLEKRNKVRVLKLRSAISPTAETQVPAATLTAAPARVAAAPSRRRKGVIIRDPEEESTT
nr:hypothetical protein [Tanacetum cinerariifolium]